MGKPDRRFAFVAGLGVAVIVPVWLAWLLLVPQPRNPADVIYDYSVAGYCGTLTPAGEKGFRRELAAVTARFHSDSHDARPARLAGWVRADLEWSNRGLGGFRHWCETEGLAAGRYFADFSQAAKQP